MNTFIEVTKEAFEVLLGDQEPITCIDTFESTVSDHYYYKAHGVILKTVTNYSSKLITQYYIQDINA
jgi:hypothetical protein